LTDLETETSFVTSDVDLDVEIIDVCELLRRDSAARSILEQV
jgi:hypothetical protein